MSSTGTLRYDHVEGEPLLASLDMHKDHLKDGTALLYSPSACLLARCQGGRLLGSDGMTLDLAAVFEARVFAHGAEMRWLRVPDGSRTVLVREVAPAELGVGSEATDIGKRALFHGTIDQTYILWGEALEDVATGAWASIGTARIGTLRAPLGAGKALPRNGRMAIRAREYLFLDNTHGNAYVGDERLLALEVL